MLKQTATLYPKAVSKALCKYIIATAPLDKTNEAMVADTEGGKVNNAQRKTDVVFVSPLDPVGCILQAHLRDANVRLGWNFDIFLPENVQVGRYVDGGHYDWHVDSFPPDENNMQRKLTAVLFLSDPDSFEGGDFELKAAPDIPARPEQGDIVVFPSVLEHRVTPVTAGERHTAVCWMVGPAFK